MPRIQAAAEIDAPVGIVWDILTDLSSYPMWNPFIVQAEGELSVGSTVVVMVATPGSRPVRFRPKILAFEPQRLLRWRERLLLPGVFDGTHSHELTALGAARTRYHQYEDITGVATPFLGRMLKATEEAFGYMCQAVKTRAENRARATG